MNGERSTKQRLNKKMDCVGKISQKRWRTKVWRNNGKANYNGECCCTKRRTVD